MWEICEISYLTLDMQNRIFVKNLVVSQQAAVPISRILYNPILCCEININQTEPGPVPFGPLKIIGEAPCKIAIYIHAFTFGNNNVEMAYILLEKQSG